MLVLSCVAPAAAAAAGSDPLFTSQWALSEPSATGAQEAWTRSNGAGIVVAVLDTGVQLDHPDLAGSIWTNPREIPGNGIDDDGNGIVDDVHGANMLNGSGNVHDDNGHGTHVAGIVAARRGNGIGGAGIAPGATILPVKVLGADLTGDTTALANGIRYAVAQGARIINVSINSNGYSDALAGAVRHAGAQGATIVASAGNSSRSIDLLPSFPASLPDPALLAVAATDQTAGLARLSNFGLLSVDLAAPGTRIASTTRGSGYQYRQGTSAAAPFVAGSLALLAAARPDLSQSALRGALLATAQRTGKLTSLIGAGRLDVGAAMRRVAGSTGQVELIAGAASVGARPRLRLRSTLNVRPGRRSVLRWTSTGTRDVVRWRISLNGRAVATVRSGKTRRVTRTIRRAGSHRWGVVGFNATGRKIVTGKRVFRVKRAARR
ncbi:MAG: S8 family peptidase [Solirubrobacteraceae bacterium]|nr:S8 family peptidase [Solirubrobacteraceae bacterium]